MKKIIIVTGANRGLGKSLVDVLLKSKDTLIISLSRSLNEEHKNITSDKLTFIKTDLSESFSSDQILQTINKYIVSDTSLYFFNNAGIITPISSVGGFKERDVEISILVNVKYPVDLTNFILKNFKNNRTVFINISSGAANNPVAHWSLYCASKAFLSMFFKVLIEENKDNEHLEVYNINPGTMDTGMQEEIRDNSFPRQDYFTTLKKENKLISPEDAALKTLKEINYVL